MNDSDAVRALAALAQDSRLQIFRRLVGEGPAGLTPGALSQALDIPPPALSFHLKELHAAGLVSQERDGRHLIYRAAFPAMNALLAYLTAHCCDGQACELQATSTNECSVPSAQPKRNLPMSKTHMNVLFICTANSARSIMAEALMNQLGGGRFRAYSAGSHPAGQVHPKALELLERNRFRTGELRSKNWDEFAGPDAPAMDFVLTVCDKAAGEMCPVWPGQPMSAHWGVEDPGAAVGTPAEIERAFTDAFMVLQRRISLFLNLPFEKLEKLSLQEELNKIGRTAAAGTAASVNASAKA